MGFLFSILYFVLKINTPGLEDLNLLLELIGV
jgi:hypothetical protein